MLTRHTLRWLFGLILSILAEATLAYGDDPPKQQDASSLPPPVELTAQQDHKRTMELLNIKELRPGANGRDRSAPNAANYDEAKANPYSNLPEPLVLKDGRRVTSAEVWWNERRAEIVEDFDREIYGRVPKDTPKVNWEVIATESVSVGDIAAVTKRLVGHVDNSSYPHITVDIQLSLTTPTGATGPVPVMMEFGFGFGGGRGPAGPPGGRSGPSWQQQVLAKGWGYAVIVPNSIQADNGAGLTKGIIGLCNKGQPRKVDDWGSLRAWAWGASRALDYFETDAAVDSKQVGIEGLSRYGKAAIVAMAYDQRLAIGFIGSSGEGGVKLHRRNFGELVENVAGSGEYHWVAGNFLKYAGPLTWDDLPVDSPGRPSQNRLNWSLAGTDSCNWPVTSAGVPNRSAVRSRAARSSPSCANSSSKTPLTWASSSSRIFRLWSVLARTGRTARSTIIFNWVRLDSFMLVLPEYPRECGRIVATRHGQH